MSMDLGTAFRERLAQAERHSTPYRHWLLTETIPETVVRALTALPIHPACGDSALDYGGRRESLNSTRCFVSPALRAAYGIIDDLACAFQDWRTVDAIGRTCGTDLSFSHLRIEYCLDTNGFWLEPHTDIGTKLFTMLIYLSEGTEARNWGTDILAPDGTLTARAPAEFLSGLIFIPAQNTWHGFAPRPIRGVRRSLIVNYVCPDWRDRNQLAFPDRPVGVN